MYSNIYFGSVIGCLLIFLFAKHIYTTKKGIEYNFAEQLEMWQEEELFYDIKYACVIISLIPVINTIFLLIVIFKSKIK